MQLQNHNSTEIDMSGGSSSGKGFGRGSEKGERKGAPIVWDGPIGPNFFGEAVYKFPAECKSAFSDNNLLRGYDNRKEEWPKYSHGKDCVVQMMTEGADGGRRFFICPRAWVLAITISLHNIFSCFLKFTRIYLF